MVGEPAAALRIEDEVVGADQPAAVATVEGRLQPARTEIVAPDRAALMLGRSRAGNGEAHLLVPGEGTAIVRDPQGAVGADGEAVGAAAGLDEHLPGPVGKHPGDSPALDLGEEDGAVRHRHRAFGEVQPFGDELHVHQAWPRIALVSRNSSKAWSPHSRPLPDCL
jgi:hypothetical protein